MRVQGKTRQLLGKTMLPETSGENIQSLGCFLEHMLLCQDSNMEKSTETMRLLLSEAQLLRELFE
jgi:hypothetical protein